MLCFPFLDPIPVSHRPPHFIKTVGYCLEPHPLKAIPLSVTFVLPFLTRAQYPAVLVSRRQWDTAPSPDKVPDTSTRSNYRHPTLEWHLWRDISSWPEYAVKWLTTATKLLITDLLPAPASPVRAGTGKKATHSKAFAMITQLSSTLVHLCLCLMHSKPVFANFCKIVKNQILELEMHRIFVSCIVLCLLWKLH